MGSFSITHWLILLVVVVVVFGTAKLKNAGKDLGGAVKGFKEGMKDANSEADAAKAAPANIEQTARKTADTIDVESKEKS